MNFYKCPHCNEEIIIYEKEINCGIFRHGVFKKNMQQLNPHAPKSECERVIKNNLIYGCGKPFRITSDKKIIICDYI